MSEVLAATFVLAVRDLDVARRFYIEKLGFVEYLSVDGWSFLSAWCLPTGVLAIAPESGPCRMFRTTHGSRTFMFEMPPVFASEIVKQGVEIWHPLADKPWGMREFAIVTPDGHRIVFGERLPVSPSPFVLYRKVVGWAQLARRAAGPPQCRTPAATESEKMTPQGK